MQLKDHYKLLDLPVQVHSRYIKHRNFILYLLKRNVNTNHKAFGSFFHSLKLWKGFSESASHREHVACGHWDVPPRDTRLCCYTYIYERNCMYVCVRGIFINRYLIHVITNIKVCLFVCLYILGSIIEPGRSCGLW